MVKYLTIYVVVVVGLFVLAGYINTWEIDNGYPFGMLCEAYNSCKQ